MVPARDAPPHVLYNALGDTVNVAARLQALGDLVVGPATARQVERRVEEQRALLDIFEQRVAEINREVSAWQEAHVRVWGTFGPSPGVTGKGTGMGGAVAVLPMVFASEAPALPQALALLGSNVSESGQSLRSFERYM